MAGEIMRSRLWWNSAVPQARARPLCARGRARVGSQGGLGEAPPASSGLRRESCFDPPGADPLLTVAKREILRDERGSACGRSSYYCWPSEWQVISQPLE